MRLLYVSRTSGVHDLRFTDAWRSSGLEVEAMTLGPEASPNAFLDRVAAFRPNVVQVGPITAPGPLVAAHWDGPMIASSWAFDLLLEAEQSAELRDAAVEVLRRADVTFVDSGAVRDRALELGADPGGVICFPWGISREWLGKAPDSRGENGRFVFLSTRRHEPIYRVDDAISAFGGVAHEMMGAELWIAGSGSLTSVLRDQVDRSGIADRVRFVGEQSGAALRKLYQEADVYVSCSIVDGTSISLLEAMATGSLPVVSDIPGNREWVGDDTGSRYPVGDVDELRSRMLASFRLPAGARDRMALRAFDLVREAADWDLTTHRLPRYLETAMSRHEAA